MDTLKKISLKDYDTVVATTQIAINETMGVYLYNHLSDFAIYGIANDDGDVTELTNEPAKANCYLKGTLAPEQDENGNYINIVNLTTDKGNQNVGYNITMQNGAFYFNAAGINDYHKRQDGKTPWIFKMFVKLSMQDVAKSNLPDNLKKQLENVDENMFTIQQLYLDLNTAALSSIDGAKFPGTVQTPAEQLLKLYLIEQQTTNNPLFGVSVKFKNINALPPTFAPTHIDFCVTPYLNAEGKATNPDLDTLNYLIMTGHRNAPLNRPQSFAFNWVDDISIAGALAIRRDLYADFIVDQLNPILKNLCPIVSCKLGDELAIHLPTVSPGADQKFNRISGEAFDKTTGKIATFSHESNDHDSRSQFFDNGTIYSFISYKMNCDIFLKDDNVTIMGSNVASCSIFTSNPGSHDHSNELNMEMPETTFSWSANLQLYMDAANNGQLDYKMTSNFDSPPVKTDPLKVDELGRIKFYFDDMGNLRESTKTNIEETFKKIAGIKNANHFIFPGAKTFVFKNPQFSDSDDLVSNITYLDPNA